MVRNSRLGRCLAIGMGLSWGMVPGTVVGAPAASVSCEQQPACQAQLSAGIMELDQGAADRALQLFASAYALSGTPRLLLYMAHAYEQKGDTESAIKTYGLYLKEAPRNAPERESVVAALRACILQSPEEDKLPPPLEPQPPRQPPAAVLPAAAVSLSPPLPPPATADCPAVPRPQGLRKASLALFGVGAVGIAAGLSLLLVPDAPAADSACGDGFLPTSCKVNLQPAGVALLSFSGLAFTAEIVLAALSRHAPKEPRVSQCADAP